MDACIEGLDTVASLWYNNRSEAEEMRLEEYYKYPCY